MIVGIKQKKGRKKEWILNRKVKSSEKEEEIPCLETEMYIYDI